MKTILIFAHPNPKQSHVNKKLLAQVQDVTIHDISHLQLTPEVIKQEQELLGQYDKIIFEYPTYWFQYPAIVASYLEKIFTPPKFYTYDPKGPEYAGKTLCFATTTGSPRSFYNPQRVSHISGQCQMIAEFCWMKFGGFFMMCGDEYENQDKIKEYLELVHH